MAIESRFVETAYGTFHIETTGGDKPLLFIHGGTASAREWRPVLEAFGQHGHCVAMDRLGCGLSDRSTRGYGREPLTNSLFALADALGFDRFGVVGQSFGGFWALSMAFAHHERISRLVLVDSAAGPLTDEEIAEQENRWRARSQALRMPPEDGQEAAIDRTMATIFADPTRVPASFREDLRWQMEHADPAQAGGVDADRAAMARERYGQLAIPTLVVWGEADSMSPTERGRRLARAIPGARYVELPGVGHTVQIEAPEEFVAVVAPFIEETNTVA